MKYGKLLLELLEKNKSSENFIIFDWVEFLKFMQLEKYNINNIRRQIFPALKNSKLLKQHYGNLEFETQKHKGSGNVIKEIKISFDIITENLNKDKNILNDTERKILSCFKSQEIFKYIDLLNLVIKEQNINGNICRNIKANYKLNFDDEAIQSLIGKYCLDFLRYGFNRHRAIVYFFDKSIYSRAELKEISNNAKKWKFLNF